jgi:hypothetical protein
MGVLNMTIRKIALLTMLGTALPAAAQAQDADAPVMPDITLTGAGFAADEPAVGQAPSQEIRVIAAGRIDAGGTMLAERPESEQSYSTQARSDAEEVDDSKAKNGLNFIVNPYFMAPNMDGKSALGRLETDVSKSPSDIFSNLNWGVMGSVEVNNGNWGINLDVNYMNLDLTPDNVTRLEATGHQAAVTATVLKRIDEYAWIYAGVRYSDLGVSFECQSQCLPNGGINLPGNIVVPAIDASRNEDWVEGLVGVRAELPFNDKLDLTFTADVGGFGEGSDISVNFWPQLGFRLGGSSKALLGYRLIYVKYESFENNRLFVYDVLTFGPTIGLEFRF